MFAVDHRKAMPHQCSSVPAWTIPEIDGKRGREKVMRAREMDGVCKTDVWCRGEVNIHAREDVGEKDEWHPFKACIRKKRKGEEIQQRTVHPQCAD